MSNGTILIVVGSIWFVVGFFWWLDAVDRKIRYPAGGGLMVLALGIIKVTKGGRIPLFVWGAVLLLFLLPDFIKGLRGEEDKLSPGEPWLLSGVMIGYIGVGVWLIWAFPYVFLLAVLLGGIGGYMKYREWHYRKMLKMEWAARRERIEKEKEERRQYENSEEYKQKKLKEQEERERIAAERRKARKEREQREREQEIALKREKLTKKQDKIKKWMVNDE